MRVLSKDAAGKRLGIEEKEVTEELAGHNGIRFRGSFDRVGTYCVSTRAVTLDCRRTTTRPATPALLLKLGDLAGYTLPFAAASPPQWSIEGASLANEVTYAVRLKRWVLQL